MNNLQTVFNRVADWNSKRYEQEYNHQLAISLLREEYNEWRTDKELVKKLDGLCDVVFVALGIAWKTKLSWEDLSEHLSMSMDEFLGATDSINVQPAYMLSTLIDVYEVEVEYTTAAAMADMVLLTLAQATYMGLTPDQFIEALLVVCDSNDSKSIKKVASNIKANAGDKGAYFIPPEPRLQAILNKAEVFND